MVNILLPGWIIHAGDYLRQASPLAYLAVVAHLPPPPLTLSRHTRLSSAISLSAFQDWDCSWCWCNVLCPCHSAPRARTDGSTVVRRHGRLSFQTPVT